MSEPSIDQLKREVKDVLGAELSDAQLEVAKGRLPTMIENVRLLQGWAARLGDGAPALILQTAERPAAEGRSDD